MTSGQCTIVHGQLLHLRKRAVELAEEGEGLGIAHHRGLRIFLQEAQDARGVVRLHVVHDQVIRLSVSEGGFHISEPLLRKIHVRRIHDRSLLVEDHIGIVGHSQGDLELALKEVDLMVVDAGIQNGF